MTKRNVIRNKDLPEQRELSTGEGLVNLYLSAGELRGDPVDMAEIDGGRGVS